MKLNQLLSQLTKLNISVSIKCGMLRSVHTKLNASVSIKYGMLRSVHTKQNTSVSIKYEVLQLERGGNTFICGNKCFYQVRNITVGKGREYLHLWKQVFLSSTEYYSWREEGIP